MGPLLPTFPQGPKPLSVSPDLLRSTLASPSKDVSRVCLVLSPPKVRKGLSPVPSLRSPGRSHQEVRHGRLPTVLQGEGFRHWIREEQINWPESPRRPFIDTFTALPLVFPMHDFSC